MGLGRAGGFALNIFLMAKQIPCIDQTCREFIGRQKIFFAASAAAGAHINLSPRGADLFAVIDELTVAYLSTHNRNVP